MNVLDMLNAPWAIMPDKLAEMCAIYAAHRNGETADLKAIEAAIGRPLSNEPKPYQVQDGVAIIPVEGIISKRMTLFSSICGGTSYTQLQSDLATALTDPDVTAIILSIDSPGGAVDGAQGAAEAVYAARAQKPIASYVDGMMASAAYWIGSAASQIYMGSDTDVVGSIGVVMSHIDTSNAEYQRGVKITDITAGKYKRIASQHTPLTQEGRASIQDELDQVYGVFVDAVATYRGKDSETVATKMADGRVFRGKKAIDAGLADGRMTLPQLIQRMKSQKGNAASGRVPQLNPTKGNRNMAATENEPITFTSAQLQTAKDEAHKAGVTEGIAQGRVEGATAERERIQAVEKALLPGHEKLVASLKFDGKTSGPGAALQVVAAENKLRGEELANMRNGSPKPVPESAGTNEADAKVSAESQGKKPAKAIDAKATAIKARELVAKAKAEGRTITYATAVKQVLTAK